MTTIFELDRNIEEKIDELADEMTDLCEAWKRSRERGHTTKALRFALVMAAEELIAIAKQEQTDP